MSDLKNLEPVKEAFELLQEGEFEAVLVLAERHGGDGQSRTTWLNLLGASYRALGELEKAADSFRALVSLSPQNPEAHNNLAIVLKGLNNYEEANSAFREAISLDPGNAAFHYNLGNLFFEENKLLDAANAFDRAENLKSDYQEAIFNKGLVLQKLGAFEEAILALQRVLSIHPGQLDALNSLGNVLVESGQLERAVEAYDAAILMDPEFVAGLYNRGLALHKMGLLQLAKSSFERVLSIQPAHAEAWNDLGSIFFDQNDDVSAAKAYEESIAQDPSKADARFNLSLVRLRQEELREGFELFEWRWKAPCFSEKELVTEKPRWRKSMSTARVFLWSEQGIGDELMLASMIPDLFQKVSALIVECDQRLIPLFERSFPKEIRFVPRGGSVKEEEYDAHIPIGSLPRLFRPTLESFERAYSSFHLAPDAQRVSSLKKLLKDKRKKRILGISWRTQSAGRNASSRDITLEEFAYKLGSPETLLVSLQYGDVSSDISRVEDATGITVLELDSVDNLSDIDGLAALIMACDSIVSIDNATVHLAGALGAVTKVLLPIAHDWRWGKDRSRSIWYKTLSLHQQKISGDWGAPLDQICRSLRKLQK